MTKVAVYAGDKTYSYADLVNGSACYANTLTALGVRQGDRVCAYIDKSIDNIFLYLACLRAGIVYQPLNPAFRPAEIDYYLADASPAMVVCSTLNGRLGKDCGKARRYRTGADPGSGRDR